MVKSFICGAGGFHNQKDDDVDEAASGYSSPRKQRKSTGIGLFRARDGRNPYAGRGLDKFSALLAEVEHKKKEIYTQKDSQDISFVRFVCSDSHGLKPVVVRVRGKREDRDKPNSGERVTSLDPNHSSSGLEEEEDGKMKKKKRYSWKTAMDMWRPCWYLPVAMILIMFFLAVFGRSFAILCTSIGWYLVPAMAGKRPNERRPGKNRKKKKEYARRLSEKKIASDEGLSSPRSVEAAASPPRRKSC